MKKISGLGVCCLVAMTSAGCFGFDRKSTTTGPTASGVAALLGNWSSASVIPSPNGCSDFKWSATEQSANTARGTFSATCAAGVKLAGTAQGTLSGSTVDWAAEGTASAAEIVSCRFALTGTAELAADSIRVPYSGDTCVGHVSGVEVLRKQ